MFFIFYKQNHDAIPDGFLVSGDDLEFCLRKTSNCIGCKLDELDHNDLIIISGQRLKVSVEIIEQVLITSETI